MKHFVRRLGITLAVALPLAVVVCAIMAATTDEGPTALGVLRVVGVTVGIAIMIFTAMSVLGAGVARLRHR